jgi:hypothetical protein
MARAVEFLPGTVMRLHSDRSQAHPWITDLPVPHMTPTIARWITTLYYSVLGQYLTVGRRRYRPEIAID